MATSTFTRLISNRTFLVKNSLLNQQGSLLPCYGAIRTLQSGVKVTNIDQQRKDGYDVVIVGGGIVGLATARELIIRHPHLKLAVVEKENGLAVHQTGHNSGVIHTGIYYTPGTLKAKLCVHGVNLLYKYCDDNNVPYNKCGKLIVAVKEEELPRLDKLFERGNENGVKDLRMIDAKEIKEIEPHCVGLRAVHSPHTGIIDYKLVSETFAKHLLDNGGHVFTNFNVDDFTKDSNTDTIIVQSNDQKKLRCRYVVTCGGLYADKISEKAGCQKVPRIVPFRGDYLLLKPEKRHLVKGNIYPVPNPSLPFLGVHFTPRMNGDLWLGPNAVLAFKREGYKLTDFNLSDFTDAVMFKGLRKLAFKHLTFGIEEMYRAFRVKKQVKKLQQYIPDLQPEDVTRGPSGVRAQALSDTGDLVDDFVFDLGKGEVGKHILNVRNAPSPAATSSMAIAEAVVSEVEKTFKL